MEIESGALEPDKVTRMEPHDRISDQIRTGRDMQFTLARPCKRVAIYEQEGSPHQNLTLLPSDPSPAFSLQNCEKQTSVPIAQSVAYVKAVQADEGNTLAHLSSCNFPTSFPSCITHLSLTLFPVLLNSTLPYVQPWLTPPLFCLDCYFLLCLSGKKKLNHLLIPQVT